MAPRGWTLAPRGKCSPLRSPPGVNTLYSLEEWRGEQRISPQGITSPLGDKFTPGGQLRPWGSKFAPRGEVKNGPQGTLVVLLVNVDVQVGSTFFPDSQVSKLQITERCVTKLQDSQQTYCRTDKLPNRAIVEHSTKCWTYWPVILYPDVLRGLRLHRFGAYFMVNKLLG
jgi:hypothetical protein